MPERADVRATRRTRPFSAALPTLALIAFGLPILSPLVQPGMMTCSHDGLLQFLRAFQLDTLARQGILWPRWSPGMAFGYGYPLFNYYPALSLYPVLILHRLSLSLLQSWNLSLALSVLASGLTMYVWARRALGQRSGFVAAMAYMLAPYQLYDVYWRGSITESLTLPLLPVVMWAALGAVQERRWRYALIGALAFAALLLTHAPASLIFTPILLVYLLMLIWRAQDRRGAAFQLAGMLALGVGLATFFLAPAFLERNEVQFWRAITPGGQNFHNHFLSLGELFGPAQASDPLLINPSPPCSLGWATCLLAAMCVLFTWVRRARLDSTHKRHIVWASAMLLVIVVMMLPISEPIWSHAPLLPFVQFPWRFLGVGSLLASLLAGASLAALDNTLFHTGDAAAPVRLRPVAQIGRAAILSFGVVILVASAAPWAWPRLCSASDNPTQAAYVAFEESTGLIGTTSSAEYLPVMAQEIPATSPLVKPMRDGQPVNRWDAPGARILQTRDDGLSAKLTLENDTTIQVMYRAFYFPGWQARLDGQLVSLKTRSPLGLMAVDVPPGRHTLTVRFGDTPLRLVSAIASLLTAVVLVALWILDWRSAPHAPRSTLHTPRPAEWLWLIALGLALLALKLGVADQFDTPLRWRRLQPDGQFKSDAGISYSEATVAGRARLLGYDAHPQPAAAGDVVYVDLYWTLQQKLNFRVAVRLLDERGLEWSAKDELDAARGAYNVPPPSREWPPGMYADDRHAIQVLPGTPPGDYVLVAVPFQPDTLAPLAVSAGTPAPGDYPGVVVGKLQVIAPSRPLLPETLDLAIRTDAPLGADLILVGYSQDREHAAPGQSMLLTLGWLARRRPQTDFVMRLELVAPDGQAIGKLDLLVGGDQYRTSRWAAREIVRTQTLAHIPGRAESGQHAWRVTLLDQGGAPVGQATLGQLQINAPQRAFAAPPVSRQVDAQLGDWAKLIGVDAPDNVRPGQAVSVTLVWQAIGETDQDYKTFVHLLDTNGQIVAQSDAVPVDWTRPTSGWRSGEFVTDMHTLNLKRDLPPGDYRLVAGMYDNKQRLLTSAGSDAVELGIIQLQVSSVP